MTQLSIILTSINLTLTVVIILLVISYMRKVAYIKKRVVEKTDAYIAVRNFLKLVDNESILVKDIYDHVSQHSKEDINNALYRMESEEDITFVVEKHSMSFK